MKHLKTKILESDLTVSPVSPHPGSVTLDLLRFRFSHLENGDRTSSKVIMSINMLI